jgi:hypothetical protein
VIVGMIQLPDEFGVGPALLRREGHPEIHLGLLGLFEGSEHPDGGFVHADFIDRSHADILSGIRTPGQWILGDRAMDFGVIAAEVCSG